LAVILATAALLGALFFALGCSASRGLTCWRGC